MSNAPEMASIPEWVGRYIGIPYVSRGRSLGAADCWGLIVLIYKNEYDIDLPIYYYESAEDVESITGAFNENVGTWEKVDKPQVGDVVFMNIGGHPVHAGIYVGLNKMIHTLSGHDSAIECINGLRWLSRINGFYRWRP